MILVLMTLEKQNTTTPEKTKQNWQVPLLTCDEVSYQLLRETKTNVNVYIFNKVKLFSEKRKRIPSQEMCQCSVWWH